MCTVQAQAPERRVAVTSIAPNVASLGQYGKLELSIGLSHTYDNPFDPNEIDVAARFTAPNGNVLNAAAFWSRDYRHAVVPARENRRRVRFLKLYICEKDWARGTPVELFIDDIELVDAKTGRRHLIDDMETGDAARWGPPERISWSTEVVHRGARSLKFTPTIDAEESWPGAVRHYAGADWSQYDGVSLWVYPRSTTRLGPVHLYFADEVHGLSPIMVWRPESAALRQDRWQKLTWSWRDFGPKLGFEAEGKPSWRVRFTPVEVGEYRYSVIAKDAHSSVESEERGFRVVPSKSRGFVRVSKDDPHYFAHDNGALYFPIGHDVPADIDEALAYFPKMAAHGENCTYFIMYPNRTAIEWDKLGAYDLKAAAKLDWYLNFAEKHGIYFKLSFDEHCVMRKSKMWRRNPYSAAHGGPCAGPNDFYLNPAAKDFYKRRLRYIVARWGYSPHIMAWEFFAENDGATERDGKEGWGYPRKPGGDKVSAMLVKWLREMSACLRGMDPYDHLITASFGSATSDPNVWAMPEIEYTQIHQYNVGDVAGALSDWCRRLTTAYPKPMMVTEFGWSTKALDASIDPDGVCLHNGIWASVMSGSAGSAMTWWRRRVDAKNMYPHFQALRNFADSIQWAKERFRPASVSVRLPKPGRFVPVSISARGPFANAKVTEFKVASDGSVNDPRQVPSVLLAPNRTEVRTTPVFHVTYPGPGAFAIHVDKVSPDARLDVYLDGKLALQQELPAQGVEGKPCRFVERWKVWECTYDEAFSIPVPAGPHTIRLENGKPGFSWIRITSYTLSGYAPPAVRVVGLRGKTVTALWIQNQESTWWNAKLGRPPKPIENVGIEVHDMADGAYRVEWWDTYRGAITKVENFACRGGSLKLVVPSLRTDVACVVTRSSRTSK